jgi:hypothetical protein
MVQSFRFIYMTLIIECEVVANESERLPGPYASIFRHGNDVVVNAFCKVGLGVLGDSRAREKAEASPVIDCILYSKESVQVIRLGVEMSG